jgi:hypothetical protein
VNIQVCIANIQVCSVDIQVCCVNILANTFSLSSFTDGLYHPSSAVRYYTSNRTASDTGQDEERTRDPQRLTPILAVAAAHTCCANRPSVRPSLYFSRSEPSLNIKPRDSPYTKKQVKREIKMLTLILIKIGFALLANSVLLLCTVRCRLA